MILAWASTFNNDPSDPPYEIQIKIFRLAANYKPNLLLLTKAPSFDFSWLLKNKGTRTRRGNFHFNCNNCDFKNIICTV